MQFRIEALPMQPFAPLFALPDAALVARLARRQVVTAQPGTPCHVRLRDAALGKTVLLQNHGHQPGDSPFRSYHAILVRQEAMQAHPGPGVAPRVIR